MAKNEYSLDLATIS